MNQTVIFPLIFLGGGAFILFLAARFLSAQNRFLASLTVFFFTAALLAFILPGLGMAEASGFTVLNRPATLAHAGENYAFTDSGAFLIVLIILVLGILVATFSGKYMELDGRAEAYFPLLLLLVSGVIGMVFATDLFQLYLFLELMSVSSYILVSFRRHIDTSVEAGFKYLVMGSVGTIIFLFGLSFIYREIGHLSINLADIGMEVGLWRSAGLACILVGLGVKCALVPLHTWLPDAHGRAPSGISALLSGILIQSVFYVMLKLGLAFGLQPEPFGKALLALAILNMTTGNVMALVQTNTKRLLGYSSIAQMGYIMLCVGWGLRYDAPLAVQAGFLLILAHAAMKSLAFLCKGTFHFYFNATSIEQLRGIGLRQPQIAVPFGVALLGLAGLPPLAGFAGKWLILSEGIKTVDPVSYGIMAIFLLNSLISLGYYLPLLLVTFSHRQEGIREKEEQQPVPRTSPWMAYPILVLTTLVFFIGIWPGVWLDFLAGTGSYLLSPGR